MAFHCCSNLYFYPTFLLMAEVASLVSSYVLIKQRGVPSPDLFHSSTPRYRLEERPGTVVRSRVPHADSLSQCSGSYIGHSCSVSIQDLPLQYYALFRSSSEMLENGHMLTFPLFIFLLQMYFIPNMSIIFKYKDLHCGILIVHMCF